MTKTIDFKKTPKKFEDYIYLMCAKAVTVREKDLVVQ